MNLPHCLLITSLLLVSSAHAIINFGKTNAENTTDPATGVPFTSVAEITFNSLNDPRGSGVYLGNRYVLTANHVDINLSGAGRVRFDPAGPSTLIDTTFTPVQVAPGLDLKIIRLVSDPGVPAVKLLSTPIEAVASATLVAWGIGRDPADPVDSLVVNWGTPVATQDKRWGENVLRAAQTVNYSTYSYEVLTTVLGSDIGGGLGENEAAAATLDSGGALFQYLAGEWQLVGIATIVETQSSSTFATDTTGLGGGDENYFARISTYAEDIEAIIPEPATYALAFGALALLVATRRRTRRA